MEFKAQYLRHGSVKKPLAHASKPSLTKLNYENANKLSSKSGYMIQLDCRLGGGIGTGSPVGNTSCIHMALGEVLLTEHLVGITQRGTVPSLSLYGWRGGETLKSLEYLICSAHPEPPRRMPLMS